MGVASTPTSWSRQPTSITPRPHCCRVELQTYPEKWWASKTPSPGALLLMLGVEGALPQLAHHTLLFTEDWRANFDDIFGRHPRIPQPASLYVCRPSATDPSVAPAGHENLFVLVPVPADPSLGRGGIDGDGDAAVETAADRVIAQLASWCGIPDLADRIVVRRTVAPGDFAADLHAWRGNALGLAHTLGPERGVPAAERLAQGRRSRRTPGASALPGHRPADVPHLGGARRQATARRPVARAHPGAREGVTCRDCTSRRSSPARPAWPRSTRAGGWPRGATPGRTAAAVGIGTAFFLAWDAVGIATGVFVKGDSPLLLGIDIAPQLPLEEPFFLAFLSYLALVVVGGRRAPAQTPGADRMPHPPSLAGRSSSDLPAHRARRSPR